MRQHEVDLLVIGTGTGLDVASWAVSQGWRVAIAEKGPAGGTCLNRGCIPSKMLIHVADVARVAEAAAKLGIRYGAPEVRFDEIMQRVRGHVDGESARIDEALRRSSNLLYLRGEAHFVGRRSVRVGEDEVVARRIVLATGARPRIPPIPGLQDVPYITSTEALSLDHLPESMIILGGGYIAAELGHFYGTLGTRITVVHRHAAMLPREDLDISTAFTHIFGARHDLRLRSEAARVARKGSRVLVGVRQADGRREVIEAEQLLVAAGITPNSDTLRLDVAGVALDGRGYIAVDPMLRTSAPDVWALGDAAGRFAFKHSANHEARYLIHNLAHPDDPREVSYHAMPHAIFSDPQVAAVGATEDELRVGDVPYLVARAEYEHTGMGSALMERDGFVKFLVEPETTRILGCHILGPEAATLIHEVLVAMTAGSGTLDDILETIHIHPALSEVVQRAAANVAAPAAHHPTHATHP